MDNSLPLHRPMQYLPALTVSESVSVTTTTVARFILDFSSLHQRPRLWHIVERQRVRMAKPFSSNVVDSYGPRDAPRLIVGAQYYVLGEHPGDDDSARRVAGESV